ncbi:hypothetical protein GF376_01990 [Candidatus Peregrinibacteria bacterium]|nr:hypothetical protein [Candidatus Peregrinibacteria bacterium]
MKYRLLNIILQSILIIALVAVMNSIYLTRFVQTENYDSIYQNELNIKRYQQDIRFLKSKYAALVMKYNEEYKKITSQNISKLEKIEKIKILDELYKDNLIKSVSSEIEKKKEKLHKLRLSNCFFEHEI